MAVSKDARDLSRRKLRYRLYCLKNTGKSFVKGDGIKKFFEGQDEFDGWHNFSKTWDVGEEGEWPEGHWVAVARKRSIEDEWNDVLVENAAEMFDSEGVDTFDGEGVDEDDVEDDVEDDGHIEDVDYDA